MILTYAGKSLSNAQISLMKLAMSLRIYSPAIENFRQVLSYFESFSQQYIKFEIWAAVK